MPGARDSADEGSLDVQRVVEDLDRKISLDEDHEEHLGWKTASNVWVLRAESVQARGKRAKHVLWMPDHEDRAILLLQHLQTAQVTRAELFESDAHRKHVTFHDLRATGITWSAARGDDPLRIKQRAGHKAFSTTEVYIREAENLREGFGEPFPTLPAELTAMSASISAFGVARPTAQSNFPGSGWSNGGSNQAKLLKSRRFTSTRAEMTLRELT